jgi:nucleoside-diphosphate-sugar epimerase
MQVFVAGATGYLGVRLSAALRKRGHLVTALCRLASQSRLPDGVSPAVGDALQSATFKEAVPAGSVYVHLVGTPHPAPWKKASFERVDLGSLREALIAARHAGAAKFVFVSVAHPAPVMRDYIAIRTRCESLIRQSGLRYAILRPWYVLGPGHRWPLILQPFYALASLIGPWREGARRLGLVTVDQMVEALVGAVESNGGVEILDVPAIRRAGALRADR